MFVKSLLVTVRGATLALVSFVCMASPVQAGADLMQVYELAKTNDPAFARVEYLNRATAETKRQAFAGFLPTLMAEGEYIDTSQDIISSDNSYFDSGTSDYNSTTYTISLVQPIFNYSTWKRYDQSKAQVAQAAMEYEVAKQDLMMRSAEVYFEALVAVDNLDFAKSEVASISLNNRAAEKRYSAGLATVTDLYDSRARLSTSTARVTDAENILDDSLRGVEEITGSYFYDLVPCKDGRTLNTPNPLDEEEWVHQALQQNPSILMKRQEVEVAAYEVKRQKAGHYPTVDLVGRFNNRDTDGSLFGGGSEVETTEVLLTAKLPLYQGGYISSRTREAKYLLKAAKRELTREERAVERLVRKAYQRVLGSIRRVEALGKAVEAQELTLKAKHKGFKSGLLTGIAVLDAERDLYYIRLDYATARYDYLLNSLRLKQGAGILQEQDLITMNEWFGERNGN